MGTNSLFGTDGIRSTYGQYPLDIKSLPRLGDAMGTVLQGSRILMAMDTRQSGPEIIDLLTSGIAGRAETFSLDVQPTPGLSYNVRLGDYDYGIMITASHNPYTDNGIKLFNNRGEKISQELENKIQDVFYARASSPAHTNTAKPGACDLDIYLDFLLEQAAGLDARPLEIVLDCANGATFRTAPHVFKTAGFSVHVIHASPDGKNINLDCGSTHPQELVRQVVSRHADLGIAFDGDGDRVIFVDNQGRIIEGDHTLYIIARFLQAQGKLTNNIVVGTVVGNLGLEKALGDMGITYVRAQVGDKYVYRAMKEQDAALGGEQSGHTIIRHQQPTGDGILTALYFLKALLHSGLEPGDIYNQLSLYPQLTRSIPIREKKNLADWRELDDLIYHFNKEHGDYSRVLVRYSGTEPKVRVMVESREPQVVEKYITKFENIIESTIGV